MLTLETPIISAVAEALQKWDSRQASRTRGGGRVIRRGLAFSQLWGFESATPEIVWKYRCKSVQHGAFWGKIPIL